VPTWHLAPATGQGQGTRAPTVGSRSLSLSLSGWEAGPDLSHEHSLDENHFRLQATTVQGGRLLPAAGDLSRGAADGASPWGSSRTARAGPPALRRAGPRSAECSRAVDPSPPPCWALRQGLSLCACRRPPQDVAWWRFRLEFLRSVRRQWSSEQMDLPRWKTDWPKGRPSCGRAPLADSSIVCPQSLVAADPPAPVLSHPLPLPREFGGGNSSACQSVSHSRLGVLG